MANISIFSFIKVARLTEQTLTEAYQLEPIKKPALKDPLAPAMWRYPVVVEPWDNEAERDQRNAVLAHLGFKYDERGKYWWTRSKVAWDLVSSHWTDAVAQYKVTHAPTEPPEPTLEPKSIVDDNPFGEIADYDSDVELELDIPSELETEVNGAVDATGPETPPATDGSERTAEGEVDDDSDSDDDGTSLSSNEVVTKNDSTILGLPRPNPYRGKGGGYSVKPQFCGNSKIGRIKMMLVNEILGEYLQFRHQVNDGKSWHTYDMDAYRRVINDWDQVVSAYAPILRKKGENISKSFATESDIEVPVPNPKLKYLPYQKAGIARMLELKNSLLGDEQGLGKTIQIIGLTQLIKPKTVLVICPASVKQVWLDEFKKWNTIKGLKLTNLDNSNLYEAVVKDGVFVVSYEIVSRNAKIFNKRVWDMLVIDEGHKLKNPAAKRTVGIFGKWKRERGSFREILDPDNVGIDASKTIILTGTPIPNRITELFPILKRLDPDGLGKEEETFANTYALRTGNRFHGSQNLAQLQEKMRERFLIRRVKKDVLTDLPEKKRKIEFLQKDDYVAELLEQESKLYEAIDKANLTKDSIPFQELSRIRHLVGQHKVPQDIEFIKSILAKSPDQKVVVIGHHKDVLAAIKAALSEYHPVTVVGGDTLKKRNSNISSFQKDPTTRVCLGSIEAAGVGITLTAANVCVFVEFDWRPSAILQAEDRIHRIGQEKACMIYFLMYDGSIDANMLLTAADKHVMQGQALDIDTLDLSRFGEDLDLVGSDVVQLNNGQEVSIAIDQSTGMAFPEMPHRDRENCRRLAIIMLDLAKDADRRGLSKPDNITIKGMLYTPLSEWSNGDWWNLALILHKYKKTLKYIDQRRQEDLEECILTGKENSIDVDEYANTVAGINVDD